MKVVDNRAKEEKKVCFKELSLGIVFTDSHNNICIKSNKAEDELNCLCFYKGKWRNRSALADEVVTILNAKLVIEN